MSPEVIWLAETNKKFLTLPAVPLGEERGLLSRTAAGDRAYNQSILIWSGGWV